MEWVTQAELARRAGVSRAAVSKAIKSGRLKPALNSKTKKLNLEKGLTIFGTGQSFQHTQGRKLKKKSPSGKGNPRQASGEPDELSDILEEKAYWQTATLRLKYEKEQRDLIPWEEVNLAIQEAAIKFRQAIQELGPVLAERLSGVETRREREILINEEHRRALEDLSQTFAAFAEKQTSIGPSQKG